MHIVYTCYGGAHSSPVASAIHLGYLPRHRPPSKKELCALPLFDRMRAENHGELIPVGVDRHGHRVFVIGRGAGGQSVLRALRSGIRVAGGDEDDFLFVDTLVAVNVWMRIGGFLSRALGWISIGRPLVIFGTQRAFPALLRLVEGVERQLGITENPS